MERNTALNSKQLYGTHHPEGSDAESFSMLQFLISIIPLQGFFLQGSIFRNSLHPWKFLSNVGKVHNIPIIGIMHSKYVAIGKAWVCQQALMTTSSGMFHSKSLLPSDLRRELSLGISYICKFISHSTSEPSKH